MWLSVAIAAVKDYTVSVAFLLILLPTSSSSPPMRRPMTFDLYLGGLIALGLAVYLGYALIHPEKF
jgi:K+-transporting ATPase KdpF subunit